jgi:hypothetical protein
MNFTKMESTKSTNNNSISVDDVRMARVTIVFPSYRNDTRETCIEVARQLPLARNLKVLRRNMENATSPTELMISR